MKKKDIMLVVGVLILVVLTLGIKDIYTKDAGKVVVTVDGKTYGTYDLDKDRVIEIDHHDTMIIRDKTVHMQDADCPDKLCIKQGEISKDGQKIVCLPNKIVVEIKSDDKSEYDVKTK